MKAWGSCTPKWCEWEPQELNYRPARADLIGAGRTNYSDEAFRVTLDPDGKLRIFSVISYTDKSGRKRQQIIDVMERAR